MTQNLRLSPQTSPRRDLTPRKANYAPDIASPLRRVLQADVADDAATTPAAVQAGQVTGLRWMGGRAAARQTTAAPTTTAAAAAAATAPGTSLPHPASAAAAIARRRQAPLSLHDTITSYMALRRTPPPGKLLNVLRGLQARELSPLQRQEVRGLRHFFNNERAHRHDLPGL